MYFPVDNSQETLDSIDIQIRIDELEEAIADPDRDPDVRDDEGEELHTLYNLRDQVRNDGLKDWHGGVTLRRLDTLHTVDYDGVTYYVNTE